MMRLFALLFSLAMLAPPTAATAQPERRPVRKAPPLRFRVDEGHTYQATVAELKKDGAGALKDLRDDRRPETGPTITEGYYLGITAPSKGSKSLEGTLLFRVRVEEVLAKGAARVQVGKAAAKQLAAGNQVILFRPAKATTAQLRGAPDAARVIDGESESMGMSPRQHAYLTQSQNNLKQIAIAFHNYHDTYTRFPPAIVYGPDGKPWHSWRVLLLPFLEEAELYNAYRFNEPWNGPNNKKLLAKIPQVYRDPIHAMDMGYNTHYAVPVGKGAAFRPEGVRFDGDEGDLRPIFEGGVRIADMRDGTSNSLLVGSVGPERSIPWSKPEDVSFGKDFPKLGEKGGFAAPYTSAKGAAGVFVRGDGSSTTILASITPEHLSRLITIADGHPVAQPPSLESRSRRTRVVPVFEIQSGKSGPVAKMLQEEVAFPSSRARESIDEKPDIAEETAVEEARDR